MLSMRKTVLLFLAGIFFTANAFASNRVSSFAPENNLWINADDKSANGISEEQFNQVIDTVNAIYAPIVKSKGARLVFKRKWADGTVNSYASQKGKTWYVESFGGLARYEGMTVDGYYLVACHELSHHLGGAPKLTKPKMEWATVEGQADYIGSMKCMKEIFKSDDNASIVARMDVHPLVKEKCNRVYSNKEQAALCMRSSMAGFVLAKILWDLGEEVEKVSFDTPDTHIVSELDEEHPFAQCRLDTYFAGALCNKDLGQSLSDADPLQGTCNSSTGDELGVRPLCWYVP